eukprot:GAHX01000651.1.p1 GENE.GAHX01000651.1~~GAHX01000651.1.p1  ORF type:complete len:560 (-),score=132.35 GAHX01000651.1:38-1501(-)
MIKLYGKGFSASELTDYTCTVHHNLLSSVLGLIIHIDALKEEGLPDFFTPEGSSDAYVLAPAEAHDWLVSTINDAFMRNGFTEDVDSGLAFLLCDLERLEQEGLNSSSMEPQGVDENGNKTPEQIAEEEANGAKENNVSDLGFLEKLLGEPELAMDIKKIIFNFVDGFVKEYKEDTINKFINNFDLKQIIPAEIRQRLVSRRKEIIDEYKKHENYLDDKAYETVFTELEEFGEDNTATAEIVEKIVELWKTPLFRTAFSLRGKATLVQDNVRYYIGRSNCFNPGEGVEWRPSISDVIRSRARTSGLQLREIMMQGNRIQLIDVGGQRSERRKWLHSFDDVTAVIFVASIAGYDQVLFEDETTNRLEEALALFEQICNMRYFEKVTYVLFLNKKDVFREKVHRIPLEKTFPAFADFKQECGFEDDADDESKYDISCKFIKELFLSKNTSNREVFTHFTIATDTSNIIKIFNSVKASVINASLKQGGLI